jgi:hypothetical protein
VNKMSAILRINTRKEHMLSYGKGIIREMLRNKNLELAPNEAYLHLAVNYSSGAKVENFSDKLNEDLSSINQDLARSAGNGFSLSVQELYDNPKKASEEISRY